ncbi:MAG: HAMP domain-containing histidine kinase [Solirubrobacteraceae bacterium]|nr:HAMP domain-containing histidine kinase [Solirubrobacteraceae bacterium]
MAGRPHPVRALSAFAERIQHRTLRTRLTGVLLALAAVGLVLLAAITWGSQRQFLQNQVDDRARSAVQFVAAQVVLKTRYEALNGTSSSSGTSGGAAGPTSGATDEFGPDSDDGFGPPPGVGNRKDRGDLPPGTYGVLRNAAGKQLGVAYAQRTLGGESLPAPNLPTKIAYDEPITVDAVSGSTKYRVVASLVRFPNQSTSSFVSVVAIPLDSNSDQLRNLVLVDGVVILLILAALGFGATRLVGAELAPLEHIAADADEIAGGRLDRRVPAAEEGTEVGRLSVALNAMLERIEEAFAERQRSEDKLRQFLSDASHELRTPLASIRGYAELQRTGMLSSDDERNQAVARIEEQAARMGTLVEDLLALARLDEERAPKTELVELAVLARDAVSDAVALDPGREVNLRVDGDPLVLGDEARLRQVFTNLLGNAVAHTPPGSPIHVAVEPRDDTRAAGPGGRSDAPVAGGGWIAVHVDDAGAGVPADRREAIFERFHREAGGTARTRGPAGAGLGLAVVRGIVQAHDGTVVVTDSPLGGARFTVTLPLADTGDDD